MRALSFMGVVATLSSLPLSASASGDSHGGHGGHFTFSDLMHGDSAVELLVAVVNFVLLIFVLKKLLGKSVGSHLDERRASVEVGMKEAAEMKAKAEAVYKEYSKRLEGLQAEMDKLRKDIETAAEADKARILDEAKHEAARLKAETETLVARHANMLTEHIKQEVVTAAVQAAEQTLRSALTADDQRKLADDFVTQIQDGGAA